MDEPIKTSVVWVAFSRHLKPTYFPSKDRKMGSVDYVYETKAVLIAAGMETLKLVC